MHYLTELAEKAVTAYESEKNLHGLFSLPPRTETQAALIAAVRAVMEKEVWEGRLRYQCWHPNEDFAPLEAPAVETMAS